MINAVLGAIDSEKLGVTMMHEHLVPREKVPEFEEGERFVEPCTIQIIINQLRQAKKYGLNSVVDCTPYGTFRDPEVLREIAEKTGLNIIASTGFYKEPRIPGFVYGMSLNKLADLMIEELTEKIGNTNIKAGIIKVGSSMKKISPVEEKVIRAAARAHLETGIPITTHSTVGTEGLEQVKIFEEEGVNLQKVIIGHSGLNSSFDYHQSIVKYGVSVGFDTIGKERFDYIRIETAGINRFEFEKEAYHISDSLLIERIKALVDAGYAAKIILSSDLSRQESYINPDTFGCYGYSYLLYRFIPLLKKSGITDEEVRQMLVENPCRIFG